MQVHQLEIHTQVHTSTLDRSGLILLQSAFKACCTTVARNVPTESSQSHRERGTAKEGGSDRGSVQRI